MHYWVHCWNCCFGLVVCATITIFRSISDFGIQMLRYVDGSDTILSDTPIVTWWALCFSYISFLSWHIKWHINPTIFCIQSELYDTEQWQVEWRGSQNVRNRKRKRKIKVVPSNTHFIRVNGKIVAFFLYVFIVCFNHSEHVL